MSQEARVGVFVCDCGSNIAGVVDVPAVVSYARALEHVVLADEGSWSCSVDYLAKMQDCIREHDLNRVVVAACTARTHEPLFKRTVKEAGLNPYLLEFVSIREQVSWVHQASPEVATEKAKDLVGMGVAKAVLLEEGEEIRLPVKTDCLVIGGGVAGMTAALSVADQGFRAILVERQKRLGGILNAVSSVAREEREARADELVRERAELVEAHPHIEVHTDTEIEAVDGYIGNYRVTLRSNGGGETVIRGVSTVIVATGMREIEPVGQYEFGSDARVVTQLQLERLLRDAAVPDVDDVVVINCVESKNERRGCCNIGCHVAVKNALALKKLQPDARVHVLYRDLNMVREEHVLLDAAKEAGVKFVRFPDERYPEVTKDGEDLWVTVHDFLLGADLRLPAALIVLTTAFEGDESVAEVKGLLKVSTDSDGFFQEAHVKLGPVDFPSDGISLCGCAKSPKSFRESCEEGVAAAMRTSIPMKNGYIEADGIVADIDLDGCTNCTICAKECPYSAILLSDDNEPSVIKALCKGCGLCAADCPQDCIAIVHYTDEQLLAQVEAALAERPEEKILGFVCHWCALGGVDMAGVSRLQYPPNARLIRVMCSARVPAKLIERGFELGAAGVLVAGCEFPTCHYITGNYACEKRVNRTRKRLSHKGYDPDRLWNLWCSAADGPKFAGAMREMVEQLGL